MVDEIKILCKKAKTNIKALERELGLGNGTIRRWDEKNPSVDKVILVANYFHVPISEIVGGEVTEQKESGLSEKDIRILRWFNSLSPEIRKAMLTLGDAPEGLDE